MPEVDLSGEIFTADAAAGFDAGVVRGDVGSDARLRYATRFELCHGLAAELSAEAAAQAAADAGLLWLLAAGADGEALAAAGLQLDVQVTTDVFDRVGLSAELAAFAELAVAGELSVGLDVRDVARLAAEVLSGAALEVFMALLREVRIEAGVWGKLSLSAAARVRMNLRGSLASDADAGFVLEHGAEAGMGAGMGYEFYGGVRFTNPKRFFLVAVDVVTGEILQQARSVAPPGLRDQLGPLEFVLPACLGAAYELGQVAAANLIANPGQAGRVFVDCMLAELQRFTLDMLALAAAGAVADAVRGHCEVAAQTLAPRARRAAATGIDALITILRGEPLELSTVTALVDGLTGTLDALAPRSRPAWRSPLCALWLAVAAADAIRQGVTSAQANASAGLIGLGTAAAAAANIELPELPAVVREQVEATAGPIPGRLSLTTAVDELVRTRLLPALGQVVPGTTAVLEQLSRDLGITTSGVLELALRAAARDDLTQTQLYGGLRRVAGTVLDDLAADQVLPALAGLLEESSDARVWLDEVAAPALAMMRTLVLGRLDALVAGTTPAGFEDTFRTALSLMVSKIVLSNVVVLGDILHQHVTGSVSSAAAELAGQVRADPRHAVSAGLTELARSMLPTALRPPADFPDAASDLAAEMLLALSDATSDDVLTAEHRAQVRDLARRVLFSVFGEADLRDTGTAESFVASVAACAYLPAPEALVELVGLQTAALGRQLAVAMPRILAAVGEFFLRTSPLGAVETAVRKQFERRRDDLVQLGRDVTDLVESVAELARTIEEATAEIAAEIGRAAAALRSHRRRAEIIAALRTRGAEIAAEGARSLPGFDLLSPPLQRAGVDGAVGAFEITFDTAAPLLDVVLQVIAPLGDRLAGMFEDASDLADLIADLAQRIADAVAAAVVAVSGLRLPDELGAADVAATAAAVVTGHPAIRDRLDNAREARRARGVAAAKRVALDLQVVAAEQERAALAELHERVLAARQATILLCSPQQQGPDPRDVRAYAMSVPLDLTIGNAIIAGPGAVIAPRELFLAVNGVAATIAPTAWRYDRIRSRLTVSYTLTSANSALRTGLNALECSYVDGVHAAVRAAVTFLVDLAATVTDDVDAGADGTRIVVRPGRVPLQLEGWRLVDAAGAVAPLTGTVAAGADRELAVLGPRNGRRPGAADEPCEPSLGLIDPRGRRRGEVRRTAHPPTTDPGA